MVPFIRGTRQRARSQTRLSSKARPSSKLRINNTTRHGADLGYDMTVVWDACASYGMEDLNGKKVDAETTHAMAMAMLMSYGQVETTAEILETLEAGKMECLE